MLHEPGADVSHDAMFVKITGEVHFQWHSVDYDGEVLETLANKTRDKTAALKFLKRAMHKR